jgi:hypothetical protein
MKHSCANCHFFSRAILLKNNQTTSSSINLEERRKLIKQKHKPEVYTSSVLICHKGVWNEAITPLNDFYRSTVDLNRNNCFFYPHQNNMLYSAAEELQKRECEYKELKRSNLYTRIGLWLATGALLVNTLINWLKTA